MTTKITPWVPTRPRAHGHLRACAIGNTSGIQPLTSDPADRACSCQAHPAERSLRRGAGGIVRSLFGLTLILGGSGCDERAQHDLLVEIGVDEEAEVPPITVDIACDRTVGSTCDAETLGVAVEREADRLASIPGSTIRLWILDGPEPNVPAATIVVPTVRRRNARTAQRQANAWSRQVRTAFVARIAEDPPDDTSSTSPLAELLTRIAAAGGAGERRISVITDARQRSGVADAECRTPSELSWLASLRRHGLLGHGSMSGIHVVFVHVAPRPLERRRCRSTVAHEAAVRSMWTAAFSEAGTAHFDLVPGSQESPINPPPESTPSEGARR